MMARFGRTMTMSADVASGMSFGNFVVRHKNARKGRNPQTGQEILLEERKVLTFKPSLVLKNLLNETEEASASDREQSPQ